MDRLMRHLKETWARVDEGFFGISKKNDYSTIEKIQSHIQRALNREDGMQFTYFLGNGVRLGVEIAGLLGMSNYVRPSDAEFGEGKQLKEKSVETQAVWQCFCVDDAERHKMKMFLSTTDVNKLVDRLPKIGGYMEEMDKSDVEGFDPSGFGKEARMWLDSFVGGN